MLSDREIIRGFLQGDTQSVELVQTWIVYVVHARLWTQDIQAEDIVSDTILKLLVNLRDNKFKFESSLKTYAQRIARFTIIDHVRAQRRAREYVKEMSLMSAEQESPARAFENEEEMTLFLRVVSLLPQECRDLWAMIHNEEMSYVEIAERLSLTEGAVKTRVLRCKQRAIVLRKKME